LLLLYINAINSYYLLFNHFFSFNTMKKILFTFLSSLLVLTYCFAQPAQMPNGDFESWGVNAAGDELPLGLSWMVLRDCVEKTTDAYSGTYAMKITSKDTASERIYGDIHNGIINATGSPDPVDDYVDSPKFFVFHYKYITENP